MKFVVKDKTYECSSVISLRNLLKSDINITHETLQKIFCDRVFLADLLANFAFNLRRLNTHLTKHYQTPEILFQPCFTHKSFMGKLDNVLAIDIMSNWPEVGLLLFSNIVKNDDNFEIIDSAKNNFFLIQKHGNKFHVIQLIKTCYHASPRLLKAYTDKLTALGDRLLKKHILRILKIEPTLKALNSFELAKQFLSKNIDSTSPHIVNQFLNCNNDIDQALLLLLVSYCMSDNALLQLSTHLHTYFLEYPLLQKRLNNTSMNYDNGCFAYSLLKVVHPSKAITKINVLAIYKSIWTAPNCEANINKVLDYLTANKQDFEFHTNKTCIGTFMKSSKTPQEYKLAYSEISDKIKHDDYQFPKSINDTHYHVTLLINSIGRLHAVTLEKNKTCYLLHNNASSQNFNEPKELIEHIKHDDSMILGLFLLIKKPNPKYQFFKNDSSKQVPRSTEQAVGKSHHSSVKP